MNNLELHNIEIPHKIKIVYSIQEVIIQLRSIFQSDHYDHKSTLWVTGAQYSKNYFEIIVEQLGITNPKVFTVENSYKRTADRLNTTLKAEKIKYIVSLGSGKVIDVCKYCANQFNIKVITIPTVLSSDGICSPVSVLSDENNKKFSLPARMPNAIIVDLSYIQTLPERFLRSGIGDLMSNITATRDWQLAEVDQQEKVNDLAVLLSITAVNHIYHHYDRNIEDIVFIEGLARGLILSGLSMEMNGDTRPASGSEHKISHAIDFLFPGRALHGEQVAVGTVISSFLQGGDWRKIKALFVRYGVPVKAEEIRLTKQEMILSLTYATNTRDRYTILEKLNLNEKMAEEVMKETGVI